jgi:hypothetical protein
MASIIKLKRSTTQGSVPSNGTLAAGELAVNLTDKKLFSSPDGTGIITISGDQYNVITQTSNSGVDIVLTVDNDTLSNDVITFTGDDTININRNGANGNIEITADNTLVKTVVTDAGTATGSAHGLTISGTTNEIETSASGSTITVGLPEDVTIAGQLNVNENMVATGNVVVGGALTISGQTSFSSGIAVDGVSALNGTTVTTITANSAATFKDAVTAESTVSVDGATSLNELTTTSITANGAVDFNSTLNVDGSSTFAAVTADSINSLGAVDIDTTLNVDGATTLNGLTATSITANGAVDFNAGLNVDGTSTFNDITTVDVSANGNMTVAGTLGVTGVTTLGDDLQVGGDLSVDGNLTVEGALTYLSTSTVYADDGMFKLGANNAADTIDTGVYGMYVDGATSKYSGYFRDATDGIFKFYTALQDEPTSTVDTAGNGYSLAQVDAIIDGGTY